MNVSQIQKERVKITDIGLYLRLIYMDYQPKNNKETAQLINECFNVECYEKDIEVYEALHVHNEDYEKLSRMSEFNVEHEIE
jgi:hypothetical protein